MVDDEPDVEVLFRQQFRRDLRADRFTMEFAQSATMALQRITEAGDRSLILILSDINMPGMIGLELLPKAKAARPDVPIIMITAYGDAETKRKALENGAEALLTKPIDFRTLRSEIDMRIERAAFRFRRASQSEQTAGSAHLLSAPAALRHYRSAGRKVTNKTIETPLRTGSERTCEHKALEWLHRLSRRNCQIGCSQRLARPGSW